MVDHTASSFALSIVEGLGRIAAVVAAASRDRNLHMDFLQCMAFHMALPYLELLVLLDID